MSSYSLHNIHCIYLYQVSYTVCILVCEIHEFNQRKTEEEEEEEEEECFFHITYDTLSNVVSNHVCVPPGKRNT